MTTPPWLTELKSLIPLTHGTSYGTIVLFRKGFLTDTRTTTTGRFTARRMRPSQSLQSQNPNYIYSALRLLSVIHDHHRRSRTGGNESPFGSTSKCHATHTGCRIHPSWCTSSTFAHRQHRVLRLLDIPVPPVEFNPLAVSLLPHLMIVSFSQWKKALRSRKKPLPVPPLIRRGSFNRPEAEVERRPPPPGQGTRHSSLTPSSPFA